MHKTQSGYKINLLVTLNKSVSEFSDRFNQSAGDFSDILNQSASDFTDRLDQSASVVITRALSYYLTRTNFRVQVYSKEESHILLPMEIVNKMVTFKTDESVLQNHSKTCICEVKENELNFK